MVDFDASIGLLRSLRDANPQRQKCRLYHDSGTASPEEELVVLRLGIESPFRDGRYPRSLCMDLDPASVSVGCAHSDRYRAAMINVLSNLSADESVAELCQRLIGEIRRIGLVINDGEITSLEYKMRHHRDDPTPEGERNRNDVADKHSELVERLLQINTEVLALHEGSVAFE